MGAELEKLLATSPKASCERRSPGRAIADADDVVQRADRARGRDRGGADPDRIGRLRGARDRPADAQDGRCSHHADQGSLHRGALHHARRRGGRQRPCGPDLQGRADPHAADGGRAEGGREDLRRGAPGRHAEAHRRLRGRDRRHRQGGGRRGLLQAGRARRQGRLHSQSRRRHERAVRERGHHHGGSGRDVRRARGGRFQPAHHRRTTRASSAS